MKVGEEIIGTRMVYGGPCWKCGCSIVLPSELYRAARHSSEVSIFCSYGHKGVYSEREAEVETLRRERDRLAQRIAERDDEIARQHELRGAAERREAAQKGQVTKLKNRVGRGVCPCCNRSFTDLRRHMDTKHPDFTHAKPELKIVA